MLSSSKVYNHLTAYITSKKSDLLISSLENLQLPPSTSEEVFSVTEPSLLDHKDCARDTPYTESNIVIFSHSATMLQFSSAKPLMSAW
jgi:hypothetical protein